MEERAAVQHIYTEEDECVITCVDTKAQMAAKTQLKLLVRNHPVFVPVPSVVCSQRWSLKTSACTLSGTALFLNRLGPCVENVSCHHADLLCRSFSPCQ